MVKVYHGKSSAQMRKNEELREGSFVGTEKYIAEYYAKIARGRFGGVPIIVTFDVPKSDLSLAEVTDSYKHKGAKSLLFKKRPRQKVLGVDWMLESLT